MRKLSEILPLIRPYLRSPENPYGETYICYAINCIPELSHEELYAIEARIHYEVSPHLYLYKHLRQTDAIMPHTMADDPEYWPARDAWLDELQARLEAEEAEECPPAS